MVDLEIQGMLGSAEKAKRLVAEIKGFAGVTPFETAGLAANAKMLLAFGTSGAQVLPILSMLGDVAGGSQEKLNQLTLAFGQISSAGKLQGQDLLQLINAGFNPLQEISRTTGKSMADLREEMEKGGISAQMVSDAFTSATSKGGRFFGNTAAQGRTFHGLLSTLKDGIADLYRSFGQPVMLALKPVLEQAAAIAATLRPIAAELGARFAGMVASVGQVASTLARGLLGAARSGEIGVLFTQALKGAGQVFLTSLGSGAGSLLRIVAAGLKGAFQSAVALLRDESFWSGIKSMAMSIGYSIKALFQEAAADILSMLPGKEGVASEWKQTAKSTQGVADAYSERAAVELEAVDFNKIMAPMAEASGSIAGILDTALKDLGKKIAGNPELQSVWKRITQLSAEQGAISADPATKPGKVGALDGGSGTQPSRLNSRGNADNLSRVGLLLGNYSPQLNEAKRTNSLIIKTNQLLSDLPKNMPGAAAAAWA